jgi:predicted RNA binding protein YcfA (HicA-like mRNA interferase family)
LPKRFLTNKKINHGAVGWFWIPRYNQKIKKCGFEFYRQAAGSHEIWYNPKTKRFTTIPNHSGDMPEGTLKAILKQANINIKTFLFIK